MDVIKKIYENPVKQSRMVLLMLLDVICVAFSGYAALALRFDMISQKIEPEFLTSYLRYMPFHIVVVLLLYYVFRIYHSLWEYAGYRECMNIAVSCCCAMVIQFVGMHLLKMPVPRSYYLLNNVILAGLTTASRLGYRMLRLYAKKRIPEEMEEEMKNDPALMKKKNIMIVGGGQACIMLIKEIRNSNYLNRQVCCVIDDDPGKLGRYVQDVRIVGNRTRICEMAKKYKIDQIIVAMPSTKRSEISRVLEICKQTDCELLTVPGLYQIIKGEVSMSQLRRVEIEDLLGRDPIELDIESIIDYVNDKTVMVTGGGGSIGSELCRQLASHPIRRLVIVDIYENNAYDIQQELKKKYPELDLQVRIASVRDYHRMNELFEQYRPDIIYHAAAHKHVPLMEDSPNEAIKNNVGGTYNMVRLADKWKVKRFVLISTDKAVNPTNIMGATKRLCEMIIQTYNRHSETEYVAVRFGNVLGSNGSVIPLFKKQIQEGGPVTVTHPDIIRYFMLIPEAVSLVLQAGAYAKGGEIFVLDMGDPVKIYDLAKNLIRLAGLKLGEDIDIKITGLRPGEKLYEELLMKEEGMQDTPNQMIHIGHPIELDEETFFPSLEKLLAAAYEDGDGIKEKVKELVDTYVVDNGSGN
ncbi:MAG: nucleoside-diphosphate sugar epimerase/dehydratase [Lachnospiraceae bacterium]|nr:nucleoside-diphosphate sugar epimerase/dehydratase [Lachnospiraceae bacterium]